MEIYSKIVCWLFKFYLSLANLPDYQFGQLAGNCIPNRSGRFQFGGKYIFTFLSNSSFLYNYLIFLKKIELGFISTEELRSYKVKYTDIIIFPFF